MRKQCSGCASKKLVSQFPFKNKTKGTRYSRCKDCVNTYNRGHYQANKRYYVEKAAKYKQRLYEELREYKERTPCHDCGTKFPHYVMDFDHLRDKTKEVSQLVGYGRRRLWDEIKKCDLVCANCHRIRTFQPS